MPPRVLHVCVQSKLVEEYMIYRKLPRAQRKRIVNYYEHRYRGKMINEHDSLSEVNECLRQVPDNSESQSRGWSAAPTAAAGSSHSTEKYFFCK